MNHSGKSLKEKNAQKYVQWKYRLVENSGQANIQLGTEQVAIIVEKINTTEEKPSVLHWSNRKCPEGTHRRFTPFCKDPN